MKHSMEKIVHQYFIQHPEIVEDELRLKSVLQDCFEQDQAQVNRLMKAYQEHIITSMLTTPQTAFSEKNYVNVLIQNQDMIKNKAQLVVKWWSKMIDSAFIQAYQKYRSEKKICDSLKEMIRSASLSELSQYEATQCGVSSVSYQSLLPVITQRKRELEMTKEKEDLQRIPSLSHRRSMELLSKLPQIPMNEEQKDVYLLALQKRVKELEEKQWKSQEKKLKELTANLTDKTLDEMKDLYRVIQGKAYYPKLVELYTTKLLEQVRKTQQRDRMAKRFQQKRTSGTRIYSNQEIKAMLATGIKEPFFEYLERAPYEVVKTIRDSAEKPKDRERLDAILQEEERLDYVKYVISEEVTI